MRFPFHDLVFSNQRARETARSSEKGGFGKADGWAQRWWAPGGRRRVGVTFLSEPLLPSGRGRDLRKAGSGQGRLPEAPDWQQALPRATWSGFQRGGALTQQGLVPGAGASLRVRLRMLLRA